MCGGQKETSGAGPRLTWGVVRGKPRVLVPALRGRGMVIEKPQMLVPVWSPPYMGRGQRETSGAGSGLSWGVVSDKRLCMPKVG